IADLIIGKDPTNPDEVTEVPALSEEKIYRVFTLLMAPVWFWALYYSGSVFVNNEYNWFGKLGWIVSIGTVGGIIAINLGHELTHKDPRLENWTGGLLLASVSYAGFKIEHIRGHHVHVSTPEDASSARYTQSVYPVLCVAITRNFVNAVRLEHQRLRCKGLKLVFLHMLFIWLYSTTGLLAVSFFVLWGVQGVLFFFGLCRVA